MADALSSEEWDALCQRAERTLRKAQAAAGLRVLKKGGSDYRMIGFAMAGIVASADLLRSMAEDGDMRVAEQMAVAYVRGILRGLDHPVHEDGSNYDGARIYDA